nr:ATPase [Alteripontixanthobacter maritimus]
MSQIALPLALGDGNGEPDRIILGEANAAVVDALRSPAEWPYRTAILAGPPRSGKSLLAAWFAAQGASDTTSEPGRILIDGADALDETELFFRWNRAQENDTLLLLVTDRQPWRIALPDLASRLGAALQLEIGPPDDVMLGELLQLHAARRGLSLDDGATTYLVPRMERSFAGVERIVAEIDRLSLERKVPATRMIWRAALDAVQGPEQARLL